MENEELIPAQEFCRNHNLEVSFIYSLQQYGLLEIRIVNESPYFPESQLPEVEKIVRMYSDLGINLEGIDAITHLLHRLDQMQAEIMALRNRLTLFEENG